MAYAVVQQIANQDESGSTSTSINAGAITVTAGNCLLALVSYVSGASKTMGMSSGFTGAGTAYYDATNQLGRRWFVYPNHPGGSYNAQATLNAGGQYLSVLVIEISGIALTSPVTGTPVNGNRQASPTGTDGITSGNITPGAQPAALIGAIENWDGSATPVAGTGFTSLTAVLDYGGAIPGLRPEHKRLTSTSAVAATGTDNSGLNVSYASAIALLEAAAGGSTVLAGVLREGIARLWGALTHALALQSSTLRSNPARLTGRLTQALPNAGTARGTSPRLIGQLTSLLNIASTVRGTSARLTGSLSQTANLAGTGRGTPPRLAGQMTQTLALSGTMRMLPARAYSAPPTINLPLSGVCRATSGRMMAVARSDVALRGTARPGTARGLGATLTISVYAAECKGTPARLYGQLTQELALRGTMRQGLIALHGNLTPPGVLPLNGMMRMTSARGTGITVSALAMSGTMRATPARLFGSVAQAIPMLGTLRAGSPRLYGHVTTAIPSTLDLFGILRVPGAVLLGALLDLDVVPPPEPEVPYAGRYAAEHASALADIRAAGFP